jgi:hypothetical protein
MIRETNVANKGDGVKVCDHGTNIGIHGGAIYLRDVRYHEIFNENVLAEVGMKTSKDTWELVWEIDKQRGSSHVGNRAQVSKAFTWHGKARDWA